MTHYELLIINSKQIIMYYNSNLQEKSSNYRFLCRSVVQVNFGPLSNINNQQG